MYEVSDAPLMSGSFTCVVEVFLHSVTITLQRRLTNH